MKYEINKFDEGVNYYTGKLKGKVKGKAVFVVLKLGQERAFYSIAALSRAVHNLDGDMHVTIIDESDANLRILQDVWAAYDNLSKGVKNKETAALKEFIEAVEKKTKTKNFGDIFKAPEIMLNAGEDGFKGTLELEYRDDWRKEYRWDELVETASNIWKQGYDLKNNERVGLTFVLVPSEKHTELPLEDYLDSYYIAMAMIKAAKKFGVFLRVGSSSDKVSMLEKPVRTAELFTTLRGCELSKDVDEEVFRKYREASRLLGIGKMDYMQASFGIHAKGYYGKHFFGDMIGYPSLDKKTRWSSPGQLMLKDRYEPQAALEKRDPMMRHAITESLPLDIFIETCNVDFDKLRKRSQKIRDILNKCEYVKVEGENTGKHRTDFRANLVSKSGRRMLFTAQDSDVRTILDMENYNRTKMKTGAYANFPSGETFVTPDSIYGTMVGDVVINIDRSYVIPEDEPIILEFRGNEYEIISASKEIKKTIEKERNDAKKKLEDIEKNGGLPKEVIDVYKKNFMNIGEFAVNTNPKAKLCNYLIVNEKIAKMIHVALGSGFEPDRRSMYHWDIVVNAPKQKMDIYGVDKDKKEHWILKKGEFVA